MKKMVSAIIASTVLGFSTAANAWIMGPNGEWLPCDNEIGVVGWLKELLFFL